MSLRNCWEIMIYIKYNEYALVKRFSIVFFHELMQL